MGAKRMAQVEVARCVACGSCQKACPCQAIQVVRGCYAQVDPARCVGCGRCARVCPADCIQLREREGQL
ncbi:MAG: 4Fe-4S binding protein [Lawsonibacter sp.]